jgi:hypothetical protein
MRSAAQLPFPSSLSGTGNLVFVFFSLLGLMIPLLSQFLCSQCGTLRKHTTEPLLSPPLVHSRRPEGAGQLLLGGYHSHHIDSDLVPTLAALGPFLQVQPPISL